MPATESSKRSASRTLELDHGRRSLAGGERCRARAGAVLETNELLLRNRTDKYGDMLKNRRNSEEILEHLGGRLTPAAHGRLRALVLDKEGHAWTTDSSTARCRRTGSGSTSSRPAS